MSNYEIAKTIYGMCDQYVASEIPEDQAIESIMLELDKLDDNNPLKYYIEMGATNMQNIKTFHKNRINEIISHETEVFDPICDGPIEHAEGMEMARDLIEQYFDGKLR